MVTNHSGRNGTTKSNNSFQTEDDILDIRRYIGLFISNWYWFVLTLFVAGILAYGINTYSERIFTVNSSLLINDDQSENDLSGIERLIPGSNLFGSQQNLQNEIGILKSFSLNMRVMQELKGFHASILEIGRRGIAEVRHYNTAPFTLVFDSLENQRKNTRIEIHIITEDEYSVEIGGEIIDDKVNFGERFNQAGFDFSLVKGPNGINYNSRLSNRYRITFNRIETIANSYRNKLSIQPINEDATLVNLSINGVVPNQEADYLNTLMEIYIQQGLENKNQTADSTIVFIDNQLTLISDSLRVAENRLQNFRLKNRTIDLSSEGASLSRRLEEVVNEKVMVDLQKKYLEYLDNYIQSKDPTIELISPSVMGIEDQVLYQLISDLSRLQKDKKDLTYNIEGLSVVTGQLDSKIVDAKLALRENIINSLSNLQGRLSDIDYRITQINSEVDKLPLTERQLVTIQREFELNNTVYTYLLEKRSEAGIAKASNVSSNRIIDFAEVSNALRVKPQENRNYLIALLLGLLIPAIYIFLIDQFHSKILDKRDIEYATDAPIIGYIGHSNKNEDLPVIKSPGSSLSESFRAVRTNLKYYVQENKAMILITSTLSGEGKTFISSNLAGVYALLGRKTLLVGVDLRKPRLNRIFKTDSDIGLSNYLIGEAELENIIYKTNISNLFFVPSGQVPPNPAELIESEKMTTFLQYARKEFDFVILDTPPIGIVSDALLLARQTDINLFVVRQRYSFKSTIDLIQELYDKKELKNISIAINDIHISGYYGYGLRYGYGFYPGYGYTYGYGSYGNYRSGNYQNYYLDE